MSEEELVGAGILLALIVVVVLAVVSWQALLALVGILILTFTISAVLTRWIERKPAKDSQHAEEQRDIAARALKQHMLYLQGDAAGIYGNYPPIDIDALPANLNNSPPPPPPNGSISAGTTDLRPTPPTRFQIATAGQKFTLKS